jgi:hypothetical protein
VPALWAIINFTGISHNRLTNIVYQTRDFLLCKEPDATAVEFLFKNLVVPYRINLNTYSEILALCDTLQHQLNKLISQGADFNAKNLFLQAASKQLGDLEQTLNHKSSLLKFFDFCEATATSTISFICNHPVLVATSTAVIFAAVICTSMYFGITFKGLSENATSMQHLNNNVKAVTQNLGALDNRFYSSSGHTLSNHRFARRKNCGCSHSSKCRS